MLTITEIKRYAELTNTNIEIEFPVSVLRNYIKTGDAKFGSRDYKTYYKTTVGIQNGNAWFWFETLNLFDDDKIDEVENMDLFFSHRYNCASGHTIRAWNTGYKFQQKIKNAIAQN